MSINVSVLKDRHAAQGDGDDGSRSFIEHIVAEHQDWTPARLLMSATPSADAAVRGVRLAEAARRLRPHFTARAVSRGQSDADESAAWLGPSSDLFEQILKPNFTAKRVEYRFDRNRHHHRRTVFVFLAEAFKRLFVFAESGKDPCFEEWPRMRLL